MPSSRQKIIRGLSLAATGALPKVSMSAADYALGAIANGYTSLLRYSVVADRLSVASGYTVFGNDRGSGKPVTARRDSVSIAAGGASFNNHNVFDFVAGSGVAPDLKIDSYPLPSMTWFAVVSIDPALKASPASARILSLVDPDTPTTKWYMGLTSAGSIQMGATSVSGEMAVISSGNVPAGDVPFVICGSYSYSLNRMRIYLNNSTLISTGTPAAQIAVTTGHRIGIGGSTEAFSVAGWKGKIARVDVFDTEMTAAQIGVAMSALKAEYGIA